MYVCLSGILCICQVVVVVIGNVLEWYDFIVYGFFFSLIVRLFFFFGDEYILLLMVLVIFGVGFFMCLVGGVLFGLYVDCRGCKVVM